jgi:uncharacterized cofD-like protein
VAVGGGHGAAQSIRALRTFAGEITAIISVADDGGSSGRLRELLGIPAPGDLRRCIGALLAEPTALGEALEHRFEAGELKGHAFGNLLIAALAASTGDFTKGVAEAARLAGAAGTVLPATGAPVTLLGNGKTGEVAGQARIMRRGGVTSVHLEPEDPAPAEGTVEALVSADQIVIGPGSLFTSVLAAVAVPGLRCAIAQSSAQRVYVANLQEQHPETTGFDVADHVATLISHGVFPDVVLADEAALPLGSMPVGTRVVTAKLAEAGARAHDPVLLGAALSSLLLAKSSRAGREWPGAPLA